MLHGGKIKDLARMDRIVEIYQRVENETDYGFRQTDNLLSEEWAEEVPKTRTMREEITGGKEASVQEVHFRIRKETPVTTSEYIKYDGQYYDIITILTEGRDYKVLVTTLRHNSQYAGYGG